MDAINFIWSRLCCDSLSDQDDRGSTNVILLSGGDTMFMRIFQNGNLQNEVFKLVFAGFHLLKIGAIIPHSMRIKVFCIVRKQNSMEELNFNDSSVAGTP